MKQKIVLIGSTGSIGTQTLDVIRENPEDFEIAGIVTYSDEKKLREQIDEFKPKYGGTIDLEEASEMVSKEDIDTVIFGCKGTEFIPVLFKAIESKKKIGIANKEMIVENGEEIMKKVRELNVNFIPIDSEHSGIFQCLQGRKKENVEKVILTCSGGPFWNKSQEFLDTVKVEDALNHPKWNMGAKISIDSATLMNKALEIIEAKYLFDLEPEQIEVLIHPQCIVHAIVQFKDGSYIAHMGYPDMKMPISYALYYPNSSENNLKRIDFTDLKLEFYKPDLKKFPALSIAYDILSGKFSRKGNLAQRFNKANDAAVQKFLKKEIPFTDILKKVYEEISYEK